MKITNSKKGFTIIEVVLVLAIAGMIFLVVFLAVPQLQQSRRDTQRRSDIARIMSQLESYATNNNGNYPTCSGATPQFESFETDYIDNGAGNYVSPSGTDYELTCGVTPTTEIVAYNHTAVCNGEQSTSTGANSRNVTLQIALEGGGTFCVDNQ